MQTLASEGREKSDLLSRRVIPFAFSVLVAVAQTSCDVEKAVRNLARTNKKARGYRLMVLGLIGAGVAGYLVVKAIK